MSINQATYSLPPKIDEAVRTRIAEWNSEEKIRRIWEKDASVWTGTDEAKWLDWLTIAEEEIGDTQKYKDLHDDIEQAGFEHILLMGMGGSSLCPEVLAITFGKQQFHILDSTVPGQVNAVEEKLDLAKTLFIVSSKSGSTLEPNCFKQYFFDREQPAGDLTCEKCGNGVFRSFFAEWKPGEASQDFTESTERDLRTDDPATDVTRGDLQDLNNL